jgi:hypothetical protein
MYICNRVKNGTLTFEKTVAFVLSAVEFLVKDGKQSIERDVEGQAEQMYLPL